MPEGVEVKLSAELIKPLVVGKRVINVFTGKNSRYKHEDPEGYQNFIKTISQVAVKVDDVSVRGKFMFWTFNNGWYLMNTFGMSGQWSTKEGKHPCLGFYFSEDPPNIEGTIYFNDPRHFGTIKFTNNATDLRKKLDDLGWDPLSMALDKNLKWLAQQLANTNRSIGEVLMDQGIFCGVGNYIRAEALYHCKLNPFRAAKTLALNEIEALCKSVIDVMEESYKYQGATISTYKTVYGEEGKYSSLFKVYGQKQDPLGNKIIKQDSGGRTIHWCPAVQV